MNIVTLTCVVAVIESLLTRRNTIAILKCPKLRSCLVAEKTQEKMKKKCAYHSWKRYGIDRCIDDELWLKKLGFRY